MKTRLLFAVTLLAGTIAANVQGGGGENFTRRTVEERVAAVHQKMESAFKLDKAKFAQIDSVFSKYYRNIDRVRDDLMAGGGDRSQIREKMQALVDERDAELAVLLGEANFKTWKEVIEPSVKRGE